MAGSFEGTLANIPGLGGYLASQNQRQQADAQSLSQIGVLSQLQAQMAARQKAVQDQARQEQFRAALTAAGGDPAKARQAIMQFGSPAEMLKAGEGQSIGSGGLRMPDGTIVAPAARPQQDNRPEVLRLTDAIKDLPANDPNRKIIQDRLSYLTTRAPATESRTELERLIAARDALPVNDPRRQLYEKRITNISTKSPAVQVYSQSLTPAVNAAGESVFVQPSAREGVQPRVVAGVFPPERAGAAKAAAAATDDALTLSNVRQRVARMSALIDKGGAVGSVVGPAGVANRIGETVAGVATPDVPTPALDFQNEQRLLLSDVRKMVERDPNLSKDEREALTQTLGGGLFQTPGSALRTLNNVLDKVQSGVTARAPSQRRRATDALPDGIPAGSNIIGKTPDGKDVYQSPDGKRWTQ